MSETVKHHFRLLAEVRWQIFRNSLRVKGKKLELAAQIITAVLGIAIGLGLGLVVGGAAYFFLSKGRTEVVPFLLWCIFLAWLFGPLLLEGSSPALNFRELARYPISFRLYYLLNTAYGLLDPWALLCLGWLAFLWAGIASARPLWAVPAALWFVPFALANLLFNRVLFGFLDRVMSTRRGRERLLAFVLSLFAFSQIGIYVVMPRVLPRLGKSREASVGQVLKMVHRASPPGMVSRGVIGQGWPDTVAPLLAMTGYVALGALVLWRQTWRNYQGEVISETTPKHWAVQVQPGWKLPFLDDATSAMVEKEVRYAWRNPITIMNAAGAPLGALIVASLSTVQDEVMRKVFQEGPFKITGITYPLLAGYIVVTLGSQAYTGFAFDAQGFHRWLMSPTDLRRVFLAKNLALGALLAADFAAVTLLLSLVGAPSLRQIVTVMAGFIFACLAMVGAGNMFSVWFPTAIEYGRMSAKKVSQVAVLLGVPLQLGIGGSLVLVFYLARRWNLDLLPMAGFPLLILLALKFYLFSLNSASEYIRHNSEKIAAALA